MSTNLVGIMRDTSTTLVPSLVEPLKGPMANALAPLVGLSLAHALISEAVAGTTNHHWTSMLSGTLRNGLSQINPKLVDDHYMSLEKKVRSGQYTKEVVTSETDFDFCSSKGLGSIFVDFKDPSKTLPREQFIASFAKCGTKSGFPRIFDF